MFAVPWFCTTAPTGEVRAVPFGDWEKTTVAEFVTVVPWYAIEPVSKRATAGPFKIDFI